MSTAHAAPSETPAVPGPVAPKGPAGSRQPKGPATSDHHQKAWLDSAKGKAIRVRFCDGKVLSGVLKTFDTYSLILELPDQAGAVMVYKHACAYLQLAPSGANGER